VPEQPAEQSSATSRPSSAPRLRYLDTAEDAQTTQRHSRQIAELAEEHMWLVERLLGRIAARWPEEVDADWVRSHAAVALRQAAAEVDDEASLPLAGVRAVQERLRTLLGGTEWYREAMLGRVRPLCEAWRAAVLAGREPTDRTLCARLHLSSEQLAERYVELAAVFAVEPAALLPDGMGVTESLATAVGGLDGEEQLVLSLYFHQQLTLTEIGEVLELLPVRVQELLGRGAVAILGEAMLSSWPIPATA
jgi:RNA polymerase sigma factor for flagellar operon FliA